MPNVATANVAFGVKHSVDQDMAGLLAAIQRNAAKAKEALADPMANFNREILMAGKQLEKLMNMKLAGPVTQKTLDDLARASERIEQLFNQLSKFNSAQLTTPSANQAFKNLSVLKDAVGVSQQVAIPNNEVARAQRQAGEQAQLEFIRGRTFQRSNYDYGLPQGFTNELIPSGPHIPNAMRNFRQAPADLDLDQHFNERERLRYTADKLIGRHQFEQNRLVPQSNEHFIRQEDIHGPFDINPDRARNMRFNRTMDNYTGSQKAQGIFETERGIAQRKNATKLEPELRQEAEAVERLSERYSKLTVEQRKNVEVRLAAKQASGQDVGLAQRAMSQVIDPSSGFNFRTGKRSGDHALRYGSQNAAFALEDYLISSQYGGPAAGFRAITNNLTAIAAASTGMINPIAAASIIGGVAVAGASAPLAYNMLSKSTLKQERDDSLANIKYERDREARLNSIKQFSSDKDINESSGFLSKLKSAEQNETELRLTRADKESEFNFAKEQFDFHDSQKGMFGSSIPDKIKKRYETLQDELTKLPTMDSASGDVFRSRTNFDLSLGRESRLFNSLSSERNQSRDLSIESAMGRNTDPQKEFDIEQSRRDKNRQFIRRQLGKGSPELKLKEEGWQREDEVANNGLAVDKTKFQRQEQEQRWSERSHMAGFQTDDRKALLEQSQIERERIMADANLSLNPALQQETLKRQAMMTSRNFANLSHTPDLGSAIETNSAQDLSLRQPFFGPRETTKEAEGRTLDSILKELEKLTAATKANAPIAANVGKGK